MEIVAQARKRGLRVEADLRNEKISYKVREHSLAKVPVLLAIGRKEAAERTRVDPPARLERADDDEARRGAGGFCRRGDAAGFEAGGVARCRLTPSSRSAAARARFASARRCRWR